jgi:hypothetical protein
MPIVTGLATVAPLAGLVKAAASGGGGVPAPFCTVTLTVAVPVAPALSRTVTVSVCGPSGVLVVTHGSATCVADWLSVQTVAPAALSVKEYGAAPGELIQIFAQVVPLTV